MAYSDQLVGLPSKFTIVDTEGNIVVKSGEIITVPVVERAAAIGKLNQLMAMQAEYADEDEIILAGPKYIEIGEEDPSGIHPESK